MGFWGLLCKVWVALLPRSFRVLPLSTVLGFCQIGFRTHPVFVHNNTLWQYSFYYMNWMYMNIELYQTTSFKPNVHCMTKIPSRILNASLKLCFSLKIYCIFWRASCYFCIPRVFVSLAWVFYSSFLSHPVFSIYIHVRSSMLITDVF